MFGEIHRERLFHAAIFDQIVKRRPAFEILQPVDDRKTAIIGHDDNDLMAGQHGGINIRIHHHISAVPDDDDRGTAVVGHGGAPASRDFIAHAGKAKFRIHRIGGFDAPAFVDLTRRAAGCSDHQIIGFGIVLNDFDHLRIRGHMGIAWRLQLIKLRVPFGHLIAPFRHPAAWRCPIAQGRLKLAQGFARIAHHRNGAVLGGIKARCIDGNKLRIGLKAAP